jgi:hypothetical protein
MNDLEGIGRGLFEVLFRHFLGGTEDNSDKPGLHCYSYVRTL